MKINHSENTGPLHGVPVTIKDHIKVTGFKVTRGSMAFKNTLCTEDAPLVANLKNAGAIVIGITNMPELGPALETNNDIYGQTNNPYDLTKIPGGSSGGEAAIIASCGSPLGVGSDGGGIGMQFYTPGPMARSVNDLKLALPILSGNDHKDPYMLKQTLPQSIKPVNALRIGFVIDNEFSPPSDDTISVLHEAIKLLQKSCQNITEINFLNLAKIGKFHWETYFYGQATALKASLQNLNVPPSKLLQEFFDCASGVGDFDKLEFLKRWQESDLLRMQALDDMGVSF